MPDPGGATRISAPLPPSAAASRGERDEPDRPGCCHAGRVGTPYLQQSHGAVVVLATGVAAFSAGELWQAFRLRRGVDRAGAAGEVLFRVMFLVGILLLPLGASVAPGAVIPGGVAGFAAGAVVGWLGLLLRW